MKLAILDKNVSYNIAAAEGGSSGVALGGTPDGCVSVGSHFAPLRARRLRRGQSRVAAQSAPMHSQTTKPLRFSATMLVRLCDHSAAPLAKTMLLLGCSYPATSATMLLLLFCH